MSDARTSFKPSKNIAVLRVLRFQLQTPPLQNKTEASNLKTCLFSESLKIFRQIEAMPRKLKPACRKKHFYFKLKLQLQTQTFHMFKFVKVSKMKLKHAQSLSLKLGLSVLSPLSNCRNSFKLPENRQV